MEKQSESFQEKFRPYKQAGAAITLAVILLAMSELMKASGASLPERSAWMCGGATIMVFAIFNSLLNLSAKNAGKYWSESIISFFLVMLVSGSLAWLASGQSINEAGTFRWIFGVITFSYLVFISITNALKRIVGFAQKEEWNQPRLRNRNRKKKR